MYIASIRDKKGNWQTLGEIKATSMVMARNMASRKTHKPLGECCETRRVKIGKTIYEYDNGAICIERAE
jgi:hypothetical protein